MKETAMGCGGAMPLGAVVVVAIVACNRESGDSQPLAHDVDADADGFVVPDDCDDLDPLIHPGAAEVCDGADNDCDGTADVGAVDMVAYYSDGDGDAYGAGPPTMSCEPPAGSATNDDDCDDTSSAVNPGLTETCGDGLDNDCDGSPDGCPWVGDMDFADASATIAGHVAHLQFGHNLVAAGDTNGDGVGDLAVGSNSDLGEGFLFLGPVSTTTSASADASFVSKTKEDPAGYDFAGIGDQDGDGYDDLLVIGVSEPGLGRDYIVLGPISGHGPAAAMSAATLSSGEPGDEFGASPSSGDLNGDGIPDVVVGAPYAGSGTGVSYVFYGPVTSGDLGPDRAAATISGEWEQNDEFLGSYTGSPNAADGDVNGDGIDDLLVTSWGSEIVTLFYGPVTGALTNMMSGDVLVYHELNFFTSFDEWLGWSTSIGGDLDGDGRDDLAVAAPARHSDSGTLYVFLAASIDDADSPIGSADVAITGDKDAFLGFSVDTAGDFDGDGADDMVLFSGDDALGFYGPLATGHLTAADASFAVHGYFGDPGSIGIGVLGFVGDVSGDQVDDLAISSWYKNDDTAGDNPGIVYLFYTGAF